MSSIHTFLQTAEDDDTLVHLEQSDDEFTRTDVAVSEIRTTIVEYVSGLAGQAVSIRVRCEAMRHSLLLLSGENAALKDVQCMISILMSALEVCNSAVLETAMQGFHLISEQKRSLAAVENMSALVSLWCEAIAAHSIKQGVMRLDEGTVENMYITLANWIVAITPACLPISAQTAFLQLLVAGSDFVRLALNESSEVVVRVSRSIQNMTHSGRSFWRLFCSWHTTFGPPKKLPL